MGKFMTIKSFKLAGLVAFAAVSASSAYAADMPVKAAYKAPPVVGCGYNAITAANNQISLDYAGLHKDYAEYNPAGPITDPALPVGAVLDTEKGWVHGVSLTGSAMFNLGSVCNVYVFARGSYFDGKTDYWQPLGRLPGQSSAKIWEGDFRLGKGFDIAPNFMLTPYLGGGLRSWDRDLCQGGVCGANPLNGFHENYSHGYLGAGLMGQWALTPALVLSASGLVGSTLSPEFRVGPITGGNPTLINAQAGLGSSVIYKLEGSLDYAFTHNLHGNVGVEYTNFTYGQSSVYISDIAGNPALEPRSRTETVTVRAGLGWSFGPAPVVAKY